MNDGFTKWLKASLLAIGLAMLFAIQISSIQKKAIFDFSSNNSGSVSSTNKNNAEIDKDEDKDKDKDGSYEVVAVIDGDTFKINYYGEQKSVRIIGIDTPESGECFYDEAKEYLASLISGKTVRLTSDNTQASTDKYNRLLRYVYLNENTDVGLKLVNDGYGREYTYDNSYEKQADYKAAQELALKNSKGIWSPTACSENISGNNSGSTSEVTGSGACNIKGNISYNTGDKIYHVPGQKYYESTKISPEYGERYFCSEAEAVAAGWRKSKE